jgi:hypothetical protein
MFARGVHVQRTSDSECNYAASFIQAYHHPYRLGLAFTSIDYHSVAFPLNPAQVAALETSALSFDFHNSSCMELRARYFASSFYNICFFALIWS